ncbi:THO complex subunit 1-like [Ptychodera flava]|uniref:THO complex subunit 1-like n=1 Tax=Ptychodera flava TaxID=63121 RepID=UPI003969E546
MAASMFEFGLARQKFTQGVKESLKSGSFSTIERCFGDVSGSDGEKKSTYDQAFRDVIRDLVLQEQGPNSYIQAVELAIEAAHKGLCTASTPFVLLTDISEVVTLDVCDDIFKFVESKVSTWTLPTFYNAGKNYLLRMCNDLLRRLSQPQRTVFCGRIQLFLARLFPLNEKSGLNLMSQFNLENITVYNTKDVDGLLKHEEKDESMEFEEGEMGDSMSGTPIDYNLYRKFWSLQDFFRYPVQCYNKENWKKFSQNSDEVLNAFSSLKLDDVSASKKKLEQIKKGEHTYFAKYLTSEKLFDLQLSDSNFRRYVLVQFLILFQYLNATVKFKNALQVLTDEQALWVKDTTEKVYQLMKETPPHGTEFAKSIEHILSREENWNSWKNDGCQEFIREKQEESQETQQRKPRTRKRSIGEDMKASGPNKKIDLGSPELTRLWNINPDNVAACQDEKRQFLPSLENFFEEAIEQADPEAMIEDEYKLVNNSNYAWRALRLMARKSPHFFQPSNQPCKTIPLYLENMITKLAKEKPSQQAPTEEIKTQDENAETDEFLKNTEESNTPDQSSIVTLDQLEAVANKLGDNWKTLATELNLTNEEITTLQTDHPEIKAQAKQMLINWQTKEGSNAVKDVLVNALQESGLTDIVESVFTETEAEDT